MAGKNRYINTFFWDDLYVRKLPPNGKLLYLYLLTNPLTNISGIYEISIERIAFDTGLKEEVVVSVLKHFQKSNKIKYSMGHVAIKKFIKHQAKNSKIRTGIESLLAEAPKALAQWVDRWAIDGSSKPIDGLSHLNTNLNTNLNINFNYITGKFDGVTFEYTKNLKAKYPEVDVDREFERMRNWLIDHPSKRRQGKRTFIASWLKKATDSKPEEEVVMPKLPQEGVY